MPYEVEHQWHSEIPACVHVRAGVGVGKWLHPHPSPGVRLCGRSQCLAKRLRCPRPLGTYANPAPLHHHHTPRHTPPPRPPQTPNPGRQDDVTFMIPAYTAGGVNDIAASSASVAAMLLTMVAYPFASQEVGGVGGVWGGGWVPRLGGQQRERRSVEGVGWAVCCCLPCPPPSAIGFWRLPLLTLHSLHELLEPPWPPVLGRPSCLALLQNVLLSNLLEASSAPPGPSPSPLPPPCHRAARRHTTPSTPACHTLFKPSQRPISQLTHLTTCIGSS